MTKDFARRAGIVAVLGAGLVAFTALATSLEDPPEGGSRQSPGNQLLNSTFLKESDVGRKIAGYLRCVDVDCQTTLQAVVKSGPESLTALIRLAQYGVAPDVAATLPGDASLLVPIRAIIALGALGNRQAVPAVSAVLQDSRPLVRATAVEALGTLGGDQAFAALLPRLKDADELVRENTARALARFGRPEALAPLRAAARDEVKPHVRQALETAIVSIAQR